MTAPPIPHANPSSSYTTGLPAPPRILIPPPPPTPPSADPLLSSTQDWKYEWRRQAQQILPHVYLGPLASARDPDFLRAHAITQLLAIRSDISAYSSVLSRPPLPGVAFHSLELTRDAVIAGMQRAHALIDTHFLGGLPERARAGLRRPLSAGAVQELARRWREETGREMPPGGRTLVYCESGNERSAVVVAGYVMQHLGEGAVGGIQWVQARRFCVCFDDSMKWVLRGWEPIWLALRQAGEAGRGSGKRRFVEDEEEGGGREEVRAPFADEEEEELDMMV